jgi:hypothetical protein
MSSFRPSSLPRSPHSVCVEPVVARLQVSKLGREHKALLPLRDRNRSDRLADALFVDWFICTTTSAVNTGRDASTPTARTAAKSTFLIAYSSFVVNGWTMQIITVIAKIRIVRICRAVPFTVEM